MSGKAAHWSRRIRVDPGVLGGKPVVRGTRIAVELVLECLGEGMSMDDICADYGIRPADVRAAASYAHAVLAGEEAALPAGARP